MINQIAYLFALVSNLVAGTFAFAGIYEEDSRFIVTETYVKDGVLHDKLDRDGKPIIAFAFPKDGTWTSSPPPITWLQHRSSKEMLAVRFRITGMNLINTIDPPMRRQESAIRLQVEFEDKKFPFADRGTPNELVIFESRSSATELSEFNLEQITDVPRERIQAIWKARERIIGKTFESQMTLTQLIHYSEVRETFTVGAGFERDAETIHAGVELYGHYNHSFWYLEFSFANDVPVLKDLVGMNRGIPGFNDMRALSKWNGCQKSLTIQ